MMDAIPALMLFLVGFFAQYVYGALGMGFGVTASSVLLTLSLQPIIISTLIHVMKAMVDNSRYFLFRQQLRIYGLKTNNRVHRFTLLGSGDINRKKRPEMPLAFSTRAIYFLTLPAINSINSLASVSSFLTLA